MQCYAGDTESPHDPGPVYSALHKLFKLPADHQDSKPHRSLQSTERQTKLAASLSSSSHDQRLLVVPTKHLCAWLAEHREVLLKLLSEGQAHSASQLSDGKHK